MNTAIENTTIEIVHVSDKAGVAKVEPPIESPPGWIIGENGEGPYDLGACVFAIEGDNDRPSGWLKTLGAQYDAEDANTDPNVDQQTAREQAEATLRPYGRTLIWLS